ncbi:MAG: helix-turn-helix domain-containing protein, partial [Ktedonobacteraceae bacterium]|nr:helix-turn-helix domain-containing protein [Ktedonobacteraceae bacterium]
MAKGDLSNNKFGTLVKIFREQRGWTQEELADKWGYTREYVSLIERGKRKLDKLEQVNRLADILEIPQDRLDAIGREIPQRKERVDKPSEADDILLQTLLEPSLATVKLSWLLWLADGVNIPVADNLTDLVAKLDDALTKHHGTFLKPAQQVLAYAHEMSGKIAFDQLQYTQANGHFHEMLALGEELRDPDIQVLAKTYLADILRKRGRYQTAVALLEGAQPLSATASPVVQGTRWRILARAHSCYSEPAKFLQTIDAAQEIATNLQESLDTQAHEFSLVEVLQERAQGYTMLWQPEKALDIYQETDKLRPFRPIRDLGSYTIVKAQAHGYAGDIDTGIKLALRGIELARGYGSRRHVSRVQGMYDRLSVT